ncbi:erythrocyte membrane protein 1, PfEMP1, putative [Plasmodium reichenowi]|uniref:Erythrocyte membrane protein 1, PfEMP1, putative n=1 Tax=Plasmodium reichenowi TaxID=5854 RepID=A0A2P9D5U9_PLARE|nr:erythrocyte membrane protein 1, PfEMP1, putative [Plasmodium reichenowi]
MVTGSAGTEDAKHVLDEIGQEVYKEKVKNGEAKNYINELKGLLSLASTNSELNYTNDPCEFDYTTRLGGNSKRHPCGNRQTVRFSDEYGGQCTFNRIKDNETVDNKCGACAPYRRLHLCDYNLEKMDSTKIKDKNVLLAEVCLAAKHEAESLQGYYDRYEAEYHDLGSTICTELARSFADIGDIIRGKDLYLGNDKENDKLERKLKKIFKEIYGGLSTKNGVKDRYQNDGDNFFQLREDWWTANRNDVWKALTCSDKLSKAKYFRPTCGGDNKKTTIRTPNQCRCNDKPKSGKGGEVNVVPTYFDYVPQFLRWFEEWAEDFCTKRKHKLQNAINICRGQNDMGEPKYCSGNGYNCKETIRAHEKLVEGDGCTNCSVICKPFVKWIDNQKEEFLKQIKKYDKEIKKTHDERTVTIKNANGNTTINNFYVKEFYEKLKKGYGNVDAFLELLSKEAICQKPPEASGEKARSVDFKNHEANETFCRTEYCKPCPLCGLGKQAPPWDPKKDTDCEHIGIKTFDESNSTPINLLVKVESGTSIVEKLGGLCNTSTEKNIQTWKCYYQKEDKKTGIMRINDCILQDGNQGKPQERTIHSFNSLFWHWITEMFEDSIKWRKEHGNCINNNNTCKKGCKNKCDCFEKWVKRMKKEWDQIEQHYVKEHFDGQSPYDVLEWNLQYSYLPMNEDDYKEVKFVKEKEEMIDKIKTKGGNATKENNSINTFLGQEEKEAQNCLNTHPNPCPKPKAPDGDRGVGRSDPGRADEPITNLTDNSLESDDEDQDEEDAEDTTEEVEDKEEVTEQVTAQVDNVDVCDIVGKALTTPDNLTQACQQKYGPNAPTSWKCIPTGSDVAATDSESGRRMAKRGAEKSDSSSSSGAICVPPRRRKLYVGGLTKWATSDEATKGSKSQDGALQTEAGGSSSESSGSGSEAKGPNGDQKTVTASHSTVSGIENAASTEPSQTSLLRDAFIESAAIETFFLWHNYKERWKAQHGGVEALGGFGTYGVSADGAGLVPFSGPQPTLPQAPFAASQGEAGPVGLPRGPHGQPPGAQLGAH